MNKHWTPAELETLFRWVTHHFGAHATWRTKTHPGARVNYETFLSAFATLSGADRGASAVAWCVTAAVAYHRGAFQDRPYVMRVHAAAVQGGFL